MNVPTEKIWAVTQQLIVYKPVNTDR